MPQLFYILFGAAFTLLVSYCLGRLLFWRLRLEFFREEEPLFAFLSGASLLHFIVFLCCAAQVAKKAVFLAIGWLIVLTAWRRGALRLAATRRFDPLPRAWRLLFFAVFAAYAFLYLANAMAPEMSPDGSSYHLGFVAKYLRERGFSRITTNMYANLTQGVEMLFAFAFAFGRHSSAALVHCAFLLMLPFLMLNHARRFGFPVAGLGGGLLALCAPVIGVDGTTAYIDVAVACVVFATFALLQIWSVSREPKLLVLVGLLAGFCFAAKYTAALAIPYVGVYVLWKSKALRTLLPVAASVLLMVVPWTAKNWILVGNPLSPFANQFFPNPNVTLAFEREYIAMMRNWGQLKSKSEIPLELTVKGGRLGGLFGPVFVLLPLGLLALRRREGRQLWLAAAVFAAPYYNNLGTRFLIPAAPFLALTLALGVQASRGILPFLVLLHATISWPHVLRKYCSPYAWRLERIPVAAALRITKEEKFLAERFPSYVIARMIEDSVPAGEQVFSFSGAADAYMSRELRVAYMSASNSLLGEFIWSALFPDLAPSLRLHFEFPLQGLRRLRLVQTAGGTDQWSIGEWRVRRGERELPRGADWRIRANVNPWYVQYAIDNNPVSRWRTGEPIRPGMWMELDLGAVRTVDNVLLEVVDDQGQVRLRLEGQADTGPWKVLSQQPKFFKGSQMKGLRRAAMQELRAAGIRYYLVAPGDPGADDFRVNSKLWGIKLLAERAGTRLYYIEETPQ
ncbi:MAG: glycosyltransferase family 39 protein [Bryobacteraceae bacterium]|nr:glycosyltransferase family 39 protein [Bryobacteraceae bacterium]MDW8380433.1 glycosyltransferase family 39 protein [Bryobacterales bacterium]